MDSELPYRIAVGACWIIGYGVRLYYERQARGVQRVSSRHLSRDRIFYWMVFTAFVLALLYATWIVAVANILAVTAMYLARVADEEQMMIDQFGDEYRAYMQRTGRLIPRL